MIADINLQVWLETDANTHPATLIPYVQTTKDATLQYQLYAIKTGRSGTSRVGQSGTVNVPASQPTALSKLSLSTTKSDACQIEVILTRSGVKLGTYHFDCPE